MARESELAAWLRLSFIPGLGPRGQRKLLAAFGLPAQIFEQSRTALAPHVGESIAELIHSHNTDAVIDASLAWLSESAHYVLTLADADYPQALLETPDPPTLLYASGDTSLLNRPAVAIVGSRNATAQGRSNAQDFALALSDAGFTVASGLALGIDASAHRGALQGKSSTIAVLGTGIDIHYPSRNRDLHEAIEAHGVVVSEFPLGMPPATHHFPRRNRIISGLSRGVLVVEAAISSGSLITARQAAEQGRDIYAIPGSIHSPLSRGCHALIKQGAKLVESAQDILEELQAASFPVVAKQKTSAAPHPLDEHIGYEPCNVDILCERSGLTPETVSAMLLQLELEGRVEALPGGRYQRLS